MKNFNSTAFLHGVLCFSLIAIGVTNHAPGHFALAAVFFVLSVLFSLASTAAGGMS